MSVTVSQEFVHKLNDSEVLLTGWRCAGPERYVVTARWPDWHPFYIAALDRTDPLLAIESVRQAIPMLSHLAFNAPFDYKQAWSDLSFSFDPTSLAAPSGNGEPSDVELHIRCTDVVRRAGRLISACLHVAVVRQGRTLGTVRTTFTNHPPAIYQRLRGTYADADLAMSHALPLTPPLPPQRVGRDRHHDVVLSPTDVASRYQLRIDLAHPVLFDHAVDHAPGMLLLEAARQAAQDAAQPRSTTVTALECTFIRYAEFDSPCVIQVDSLPKDADRRQRVLVSALQNDTPVLSAIVTLADTDGR